MVVCQQCDRVAAQHRFKCACQAPRWRWAIKAAGEPWQVQTRARSRGTGTLSFAMQTLGALRSLGDGGDYTWSAVNTSAASDWDDQIFVSWAAVVGTYLKWVHK